jgi:Fis family transcriptional regulator
MGLNKIEELTLEGTAQKIDNVIMNEAHNDSLSLQESVNQALQQYIMNLDGQTPANLYSLVLAEVEKPLIEMVLKLTNANQSKAAIILGISRGTLRKKMAIYNLN